MVFLSHCCTELCPIMDMTNLFGEAVSLFIVDTKINVSVHKDNSVSLVLEETVLPQFTPWSNNYASKTIWFFQEIYKRGIKLNNIATMEQLVSIVPAENLI